MRRARARLLLCLAPVILLAGCAGPRADDLREAECRPGSDYPKLAEVGAWNWCGDPKAITHVGSRRQTYTGWVDDQGSVIVASYDHDTGEVATTAVREALDQDDHANPSLLALPDGRMIVFYSAHGGVRARKPSDKGMYYRITAAPEDITTWGEEREFPTNVKGNWHFTYPNIVRLAGEDGRLYLFWRGGDGRPTYSTSDDDGETWTEAATLIRSQGSRPYVKYASDGDRAIHIAFNDGHPRGESENSLYYAVYRDGALRKADGTLVREMIDLPIHVSLVDTVHNAHRTGVRSWVWDIALDGDGHPVIAYVVFPDETDHRYRYARWSGTAWETQDIVHGGASMCVGLSKRRLQYYDDYYSGGLALDHADPSIVYLSRQIEGVFEIERWTTPDGGVTWSHEPVTCGSKLHNVRPSVPRGRTADGPDVFWMHGIYKHYYIDYDTSVRMRLPAVP